MFTLCDEFKEDKNQFKGDKNHYQKTEIIFCNIASVNQEFQKYLLNLDQIHKIITEFLLSSKVNISFDQICEHLNIIYTYTDSSKDKWSILKMLFRVLIKHTDLYWYIIIALENKEIKFDQIYCLRYVNEYFYDNLHAFHSLYLTGLDYVNDRALLDGVNETCDFFNILSKYGKIDLESLNIRNKYLKEKLTKLIKLPILTKCARKNCN